MEAKNGAVGHVLISGENSTRFYTIRPRRRLWAILLGMLSLTAYSSSHAVTCSARNTIFADVVALDQPMVFNRLGAQNVNWMMYALRRDVVDNSNGPTRGRPLSQGGLAQSGQVTLRPDLRPRPLVLRVAAGECLHVKLQNLLTPQSNPFKATTPDLLPAGHPMNARSLDQTEEIGNQVASRWVGFHPQGLELVRSINDDSSYVGKNANSLVAPGATKDYFFYAPHEGAFLVSSYGAAFGGEGTAGNSGVGLFGLVAVQPKRARFYRSQVTEEEMRLVAGATRTPFGQPVVNYEATYPNDCLSNGVWCKEGKAGMPILNMVKSVAIATARRELVHSDVNAIIAGPNRDGSFPKNTYPLEKIGKRNPTLPNRLEAFREFASIYHDENAVAQAFPCFFEDYADPQMKSLCKDDKENPLAHTLHSVRDAFMINYGSGGVGSEIIANRVGVGPMNDCVDCAYEEFFLSSFAVGDVGLLVDKPANIGLERLKPGQTPDKAHIGPKATTAYYPHDPANVHHSYMGDFVKFRNVHAGKEQHIFHLHNHQWLFNPNDDNSNYIDAQGIGPGSGYTYEIAFGGSGNRNKTAGDAIFHCHFYPHFAQGMWYLWRIHDTYESGTRLAVSGRAFHREPFALRSGLPAADARALPDGEIAAGTPIPAIIPLPGKAMPPLPGKVTVHAKVIGGKTLGSLAKVIDREKNPGYPFWIAGIEETVGSRPPTPPLDMLASAGGWDGGLPRHALAGYSTGSKSEAELNRFSAAKHIKLAKPVYFPETGTDIEKQAMRFHATREHASSQQSMAGVVTPAKFITNGAKPVAGAPYHDPCMDDAGKLTSKSVIGRYFDGAGGLSPLGTSLFDAANPRIYKGANIQLDVVFNKAGYHYPQQRILTLWGDVAPTLENIRPPEPFVMRMNTFDCANYLHTNLVPKEFYLDDYQITTPTDVIGQHIHLPKWDLTSADGSANGWNYEDGTFSPGAVRERIHAINEYNKKSAAPVPQLNGSVAPLAPQPHYYFGGLHNHQLSAEECMKLWESLTYEEFTKKYDKPGKCDWLGARTTLQRWFSDPIINADLKHRGLGITFTHDHLGPSTHQQLGLYATMLTEPPGAEWRNNETGELLYNSAVRDDGGPTTWQALITGPNRSALDIDGDGKDDSHREFFLQFGDFQHAYQKDVYVGVTKDGIAPHNFDKPKCDTSDPLSGSRDPNCPLPTAQSFRDAINPSIRKPADPIKDLVAFEATCPGGVPRPCAEAISSKDVGMMVVNYRNEPTGLRVYDPASKSQASGLAGDLAFAMQTRTDRAIPELNTVLGATPYPVLTGGVLPGDPFTPILRAYSGDLIKVKIQAGSHEHEHNASINAMRWLQGGSGYGKAPNSGWRGAQNTGLSEQFTLSAPIIDYENGRHTNDRLYTMDSSQDGMWNGVWGVIRSYNRHNKLTTLPGRKLPLLLATHQGATTLNECPKGAPVKRYNVAAVLANHALPNNLGASIITSDRRFVPRNNNLDAKGGTLVYNNRETKISIDVIDPETKKLIRTDTFGAGPLHDPTAIMFVRKKDLDATGKIKPGAPVEPLVLRANAGDCVEVVLENQLDNHMPDLYGYLTIAPIVKREAGSGASSMTTFNNNHIRPSSQIALHPQMVSYDVQSSDGNNVGINTRNTVGPGQSKLFQWYAGVLDDPAYCSPRIARPEELEIFNAFPRQPLLRPLTDLNTFKAVRARTMQLLQNAIAEPDKAVFESQATDMVRKDGLSPDLAKRIVELPRAMGMAGDVSVPEFEARVSKLLRADNPQLDADALAKQMAALPQAGAVISQNARLQIIAEQVARAAQECLEDDITVDAQGEVDGVVKEVMDRFKLLGRRQSCAQERLPERFKSILIKEGIILDPNLAAEISVRLANSFHLDDNIDDKVFASSEVKAYPDLTPDTTMIARLDPERCAFKGVEFGGINLTPPDRTKQGQKGAVGGLVVLPTASTWNDYTDDERIDHQAVFSATTPAKRATRATATVTYPVKAANGMVSNTLFRDYAIVHQKALNLRYRDGKPVQNLASEQSGQSGVSIPENSHDAGQMAVNYGSEPMWFRFGLPPDADFGHGPDSSGNPGVGFGGITNAWQVFSSTGCCDNGGTAISASKPTGDPVTGVFEVSAGMQARMRVLMPTGVGRATVFGLDGHPWRRDPYITEKHDAGGFPLGGGDLGSIKIGPNPMAMWLGGQESITPGAHFDMVLDCAGGQSKVTGDYLFRDHAGFGITNGLWGILRVTPDRNQKCRALPLSMLQP